MKLKKKSTRKQFSTEEIDKIIESQVEDASAWGKPRNVRKTTPTPLSLPSDLAARAAFVAKLRREKNVEK